MSESRVMAASALEFDVSREVDHLYRDGQWATGRAATTLAKYDDLRIVLTALKAGVTIPEHRTEGRLAVQCVKGRLTVSAEDRVFELRAGSILTLDRDVPHAVHAEEDSAFLLTVAWPGRGDHRDAR